MASLALAAMVGGAEPGTFLEREGDEICVCGKFVHTGTPVVLWMDPGGYDAYRVERKFVPAEEAGWDATREAVPALRSPNRYGSRVRALPEEERSRIRKVGWDLPTLQRVVDQFVLHYDVCGTSQTCFRVLHDQRGLSVHFMLDVDGTVYQTLDLKERAWHATTSNTRSIGIEIAHIGAYPEGKAATLDKWYARGDDGRARLMLPKPSEQLGVRQPNFIGFADRAEPIVGEVQGRVLRQYDFTPQQYAALARLTAALCSVFPKLNCDYPRDPDGNLVREKLPEAQLRGYRGILGHFHVQSNKVDPGPAMQWDRLISQARSLQRRD